MCSVLWFKKILSSNLLIFRNKLMLYILILIPAGWHFYMKALRGWEDCLVSGESEERPWIAAGRLFSLMFSFFLVLGIDPKTLCMLYKCSPTELHLWPLAYWSYNFIVSQFGHACSKHYSSELGCNEKVWLTHQQLSERMIKANKFSGESRTKTLGNISTGSKSEFNMKFYSINSIWIALV